jgi:hypothetical protein
MMFLEISTDRHWTGDLDVTTKAILEAFRYDDLDADLNYEYYIAIDALGDIHLCHYWYGVKGPITLEGPRIV